MADVRFDVINISSLAAMTSGIERYTVLRQLGDGGEANVYLARDPVTQHLVALRVLKAEHEAASLAFLQRARMVAGLGHPGIVRVLESSREEEWPAYVVLSYAPHGTLADKLGDGAFYELRESLCLLVKVADACHFAHQHGVLHGDISPANVLFDERNEPILTDFGGGPVPGELTGVHPMFSPPEKSAGGPDTVAVDVFSLGAVLEVLIGRSSERTLQRKRALRVARVAMSTAPAKRYPSAKEFGEELRRILADMRLTRSPGSFGERFFLGLWRNRSPIWRAALATLLLIGAEGGMLAFFRYREAEQAEATLKTYRELAIEYADRVRLYLEGLVVNARSVAADPEVIAFLAQPPETKPRDAFAHFFEARHLHGGNSIAFFDWAGNLTLRYPNAGAIEGKNFAFREYYEGLRKLVPNHAFAPESRNAAYISRAYRGEASCGIELSLAVPVLDVKNVPVGFLLASIHAQHTLERIGTSRLESVKGVRLQSALFAERARDRPGQPSCGRSKAAVGRFVALVHPDLFRVEEYPADADLSQQLDGLTYHGDAGNQLEPWERDPLVIESFRDPVTQTLKMGAFAPVGKTSIAVGVFVERDQLGPWHSLPPTVIVWAILGNLLFLGAGLWASARGRCYPGSGGSTLG